MTEKMNSGKMVSKNPTPVNEFSSTLWDQLTSRLEKAVQESSGPKIAAFDADGTLWDADAGETFFSWQIDHCRLRDLPKDPWQHYHDLKTPDPRIAYAWLAQISAGTPLAQMREWAKACFAAHSKWPVFSSQKLLIEKLRGLGFEIYIVTASIKWAVEPVAALVGIDHDHVLGITTEIKDGVIGTKPVHPITWRQGKAEGLLHATGGVRPILASGNTYGDTALLESATHIQLSISTQHEIGGHLGGLFEEERKLRVEAQKRGWLTHQFRSIRLDGDGSPSSGQESGEAKGSVGSRK